MIIHILSAFALIAGGFIYRLKVTLPIHGGWLSSTWTPGIWPAAIIAAFAFWGLSSLITHETLPTVLVGEILLLVPGLVWSLKRYVWLIKGLKGGYFHYGKAVGLYSCMLGLYILIHVSGF
jgi:hypothetical protein